MNKCKDIKRNITNKNNYIEREYPDEYWNHGVKIDFGHESVEML